MPLRHLLRPPRQVRLLRLRLRPLAHRLAALVMGRRPPRNLVTGNPDTAGRPAQPRVTRNLDMASRRVRTRRSRDTANLDTGSRAMANLDTGSRGMASHPDTDPQVRPTDLLPTGRPTATATPEPPQVRRGPARSWA
jgi:hypothetical protein